MNKSNLIHALAAVVIQLPFVLMGHAALGGAFAVGILVGIEWMQQIRVNLSEENRPWPTKLSLRDILMGVAWNNLDRYLDVGLGMLACGLITYGAMQ